MAEGKVKIELMRKREFATCVALGNSLDWQERKRHLFAIAHQAKASLKFFKIQKRNSLIL